eukprot:8467419-Heterocapsa_arctica.AAC.1
MEARTRRPRWSGSRKRRWKRGPLGASSRKRSRRTWSAIQPPLSLSATSRERRPKGIGGPPRPKF